MKSNTMRTAAIILSAYFLAFHQAAIAQSRSTQTTPAITTITSPDDVTVLTMAPDGSWGLATDFSINRAIVNAIVNCRTMFRGEIGCGAYMTTMRAGWILGIRCGNENIIASGPTLADAQRAAINREIDLKLHYVLDLLPCRRVVSVDPQGVIADSVSNALPTAGHLLSAK